MKKISTSALAKNQGLMAKDLFAQAEKKAEQWREEKGWRAGSSTLHWAASEGHTETALALVKAGAHIDAKNNKGETPLDIAKEKGHTETANMLRQHGAR